MRIGRSIVFGMFAILLAVTAPAGSSSPGYHVAKKIVLGGDGGWDYLTFDAANHRLFIARATRVLVVDTASGKQVGEIPDTAGVHGIALAPESGRGFTSNGRESTATMFDLKTLAVQGKVKTSEGPDAIAYDPASRRVFTFNGRGRDTTAINAADGRVAGTLALDGRPEFAVADGEGHIFVNLEDKSQLAVLDSRKLVVNARWPLAPCEEPTGLAMDKEHRRLFVGCSNKLMALVDAGSGKVLTTLPIGQGVDATAYDPGTHLAFSSNGDGTLTVVRQDSPDKYAVLGNVETARGARTMALDPATHTIYLVTAQFGPAPAASAENPRPRPSILPNTFELLVVSPD